MHTWLTIAPTAVDVLAWLALGGLAQWGLLVGRRPRAAARAGDLPEAIWPLATLGALGVLARVLGPLAGSFSPGPVLEACTGHPVLGPLAWAFGLLGWGVLALTCLHPRPGAQSRPRLGAGLVACVPVVLGAPWAMMPPWAPDESMYHLSLSWHGLWAGGAWAPEGHGNGGFFALGDHIAQIALWMGSTPAARGAQIWAVIFAGEAAWALCPALGLGQVLWAQGLFCCSPVVLWQLGCAYVDIFQGAFVLAAALVWARLQPRQEAGTGFVALPTLMCAWLIGCAACCKVLALVWLPLFVGWLGLRGARVPQAPRALTSRACGALAGLLLVTCVACLPFLPDLAHNLGRYHSPLFPFVGPLWPGGEQLDPGQRSALRAFMGEHGPFWDGQPLTGPWRYLALPFALVFAADFASPRFDGVVGGVPVLWLALTVWAWAVGPQERRELARATAALQGAVLVPVAVWLCTSWQARFLIGPLWAMAFVIPLLWARVRAGTPWAKKPWVQPLALICVVVGMGGACLSLRGHMPPLSLSLWGKDGAARHQLRLLAVPASLLCDHVPPGGGRKVMLVWSQRLSLFCLSEQVADSYDEGASLRRALAVHCGSEEACAEASAAVLRARGITHMLVHEGRTQDSFTPVQWLRYLALRDHALKRVISRGPWALYTLAPAPLGAVKIPRQH